MFDLILRMVMNPIDYHGVLHAHELTFSERIDEGGGVYSFIFLLDKKTNWKPGQHGVFAMPKQKVTGKKWRAFSVASAPIEEHIRIGTIISETPSDFKKKLLGLTPGDTIEMLGPFGEFHAPTTKTHMVGIAGGIGITPFRSIMKSIVAGTVTSSLDLIYAGKNNYYTYKAECDMFNQHPNITIHYVNTPDEVNVTLQSLNNTYKNTVPYFISGSPRMIDALRKSLKAMGITNIVNDPFKGY